MSEEKTQILGGCIGNKALDLFFGFVSYGLDPDHMPGFPGSLPDKILRFGGSFCIRNSLQQFSSDENAISAVQRRHQDDAGGFGLIVEPLSRGSKNEDENEADSNIVLPRGSREVPKDEPLTEASSRNCLCSCGLRHYSEFNI